MGDICPTADTKCTVDYFSLRASGTQPIPRRCSIMQLQCCLSPPLMCLFVPNCLYCAKLCCGRVRVCQKLEFYQNSCSDQAGFLEWMFRSTYIIVHCLIRKFRYFQNNGTPRLFPNLRLQQISSRSVGHRKCSTTVNV